MGGVASTPASRSGVAAAAAPRSAAKESERKAQPPSAPLSSPLDPSSSLSTSSVSDHPTHLVVLVHGIVGSATNWAYISSALARRPGADGRGYAVLASSANSLERAGPSGTFEGVDVCGARVAAEVRAAVDGLQAARAAAGAPPLDRLSVVGHSMGGLVARYAVAHLFEPGGGTMAGGLRPVSFTTIATPHAGCTGGTASAASIPLVRWLKPPAALAAALDRPVAATMGRTGRQFFLRDGSSHTGAAHTAPPPLLVRMASHTPGDLPFLPALASFACRTAFANSGGDHLVGWANASLRYTDELPDLRGLAGGRGVLLDTGLASGFAGSGGEGGGGQLTPHSGPSAEAAAPAGPGASRAERAEVVSILEGLRSIPWRRVDVCYRGAWHRGAAAHNLIQVTRSWCRWLDPEAGAAEAVCDGLAAVDGAVLARSTSSSRGRVQ